MNDFFKEFDIKKQAKQEVKESEKSVFEAHQKEALKIAVNLIPVLEAYGDELKKRGYKVEIQKNNLPYLQFRVRDSSLSRSVQLVIGHCTGDNNKFEFCANVNEKPTHIKASALNENFDQCQFEEALNKLLERLID